MKKLIRIAGVMLLLALTLWLGWRGIKTAQQARLAWGDLQGLRAAADQPAAADLAGITHQLTALEAHLRETQRAGKPFLWLAAHLGWAPKMGPTLAAAPDLLEMGIQLAGAGNETLGVLNPLTAAAEQGLMAALPELIASVKAGEPQLRRARAQVEQATAIYTALPDTLHPRLVAELAPMKKLLPLLGAGLDGLLAAPQLLGGDEPRAYLLLAQNSDELRATGGFISGVGVIRLEGGRIVDLQMGDSYSVDNFNFPHPTPPPELTANMGAEILVLRDSNWSPDFVEDALVAQALMAQDQGVETNGTIMIDLETTRRLVGLLGPLTIEGISEPITAENALIWMRRAWEAPATTSSTVEAAFAGDWWIKRKDFMGELVKAALAKLSQGSDLDLAGLATTMLALLDERHLQIAVDDPTVARLLADRGWDGGFRPPADADFLSVIDSNVGFNKANAAVKMEISYLVEREAAGLIATTVITHTHTAPSAAESICDRAPRYGDSYEALVNRCYWSYLRVYAPPNSELLELSGLNHSGSDWGERNTTLFKGDFVLPTGGQHITRVRYFLPAPAERTPYTLWVRKQAGTEAIPIHVRIGPCAWQSDLRQDRRFICPDF